MPYAICCCGIICWCGGGAALGDENIPTTSVTIGAIMATFAATPPNFAARPPHFAARPPKLPNRLPILPSLGILGILILPPEAILCRRPRRTAARRLRTRYLDFRRCVRGI